MASRHQRPTAEDKRRGENALSDFSEYVQSQQSQRKPAHVTSKANNKANGAPAVPEHHDELDIIDSLGLSDDAPPVRLKHLLLDDSGVKDESISKLKEILLKRLDEGHGEAVVDVGLEDSGESMALTQPEYEAAFARIQVCHIPLHTQ